MRNILVVIDARHPARTASAVGAALRAWREEPARVHLLRIEPRVSGHVAMFFGTGELRQLQEQAGREALRPAEAQLHAAGVPFTSTVRVGRSAETIAAAARELRCDRVLLGEAAADGVAARVFGSLGGQVRQLLAGSGDCQVIGS